MKPRFPESLEKLRLAVRSFGNNTELYRLSGVPVQTISKIADGTTRFPWAQTVEAIWQVLEKPNLTPLKAEPKADPAPDKLKSRNARRRRPGYIRGAVRTKRFQVRAGRPF